MKIEKSIAVVDLLMENYGIQARAHGDYVAVDRDSMCNSGITSGNGVPEETTYPAVLKLIQDNIEGTFYWSGKTDDELFLNCIEEPANTPLTNLEQTIATLKEENSDLKEEIAELEAELKRTREMLGWGLDGRKNNDGSREGLQNS